ncbi:MAG: DUF2207 domain-containing protein [Methanimicrococcus sp.]|nr:DUF2207 domain-containing protein [Methanimicrococcus sp.]
MISKKSKQFFLRSAVTLFVVAAIFLMLMPGAAARSYSIDRVEADIIVDENGVTHVTERIHYSLYTSPGDSFNEVYRVVFATNGITVHNASGYLSGYPSSSFYVTKVPEGYEFVSTLPQPNPSAITFVLSYEYYGGINVYNDVTEFNYILWSYLWDRPVNQLNTTITIQNIPDQKITDSDSYLMYTHPQNNFTSVSSQMTGSGDNQTLIVNVETARIPAFTWVDVRIMYPPMANPNPAYVNIINADGLDSIIAEEKAYARKAYYPYFFMVFEILLIVFGLASAVRIYFKHGREPKVNYQALYERDLPTDTKPAIINTIIPGHGKPDMNAFVSTIMSLVDRDYLSIRETGAPNWRGKEKREITLKFERAADSSLESFETSVYQFLRRYAVNDEIVWKDFQKKLSSNDSFYKYLNGWNASVTEMAKFHNYFDGKGNHLLSTTGIGVLAVSFLVFFLSEIVAPSEYFPATTTVSGYCLLGGLLGIALVAYPRVFKKTMGRWTEDGRVFYLKWKNFEKYLTDYSLIAKYPPASVIIWDHYIVYAMALGVAETALKNMKLATPIGQMERSNFIILYYYPFFYMSMRGAYTSSAPQKGGSGRPGGGFGGGGIGGGFGGGFGGLR